MEKKLVNENSDSAEFDDFAREVLESEEFQKLINPILNGMSNESVLENQKIIIQNQKNLMALQRQNQKYLKRIAKRLNL